MANLNDEKNILDKSLYRFDQENIQHNRVIEKKNMFYEDPTEKNEQTKKPLVYTKRIKRLIVTTTILYLIIIYFMFHYQNNERMSWMLVTIFAGLTYFNSLVVLLANYINFPVEKMVYFYYKNKAQGKLKSMNNLKVVGITGSYGKTSSKNILSDILNIK